jgi:WD40 repeat protein
MDNTIRLWERETGKEIRRFGVPAAGAPLPAPGQPVVMWTTVGRGQPLAALSRDGKTLAAVVGGNNIQLWDVQTGKEIRQIKGPANGMATLLFAPDGKALAVRGGNQTIVLLDTETGNEIRQIKSKQQQGGIRIVVGGAFLGDQGGLAFSKDGKTLASNETEFDQAQQKINNFVKLSEVATGNEVRRIEVTPNGAFAIAFSPDSDVLALSSGNTVHLHDAGTGKEIRKIDLAGGALALSFAPDGKTLAGKGRDQTIRVWETETGKEIHKIGDAGPVPAGNLALLRFGVAEPRSLAFSHDGKTLATGSGNTVRMWDTATGKELVLADGHRGPISAIGVSGDGKTLLSRGADNVIRCWDLAEGREVGQFREPAGTASVAFSPDAQTVALALTDGTIRLHEAATGKQAGQLKGHPNGAATLVFSPDGKTLASHGAIDNLIRLHDVAKRSDLRQIPLQPDNAPMAGGFGIRGGFGGSGVRLSFSPDNLTVVAQVPATAAAIMRNPGAPPAGAAPGTTLRMWDVATGKEIRNFTLPAQRGVGSIALSPDGRLVATENADTTVSLWEIASGKERSQFGKPANAAGPAPAPALINIGGNVAMIRGAGAATGNTLAFSPDGRVLACKGPGYSIRVWDVDAAKEIGEFKGHDGAIAAVAFTGDGKRLASGSSDTTVLLWDAASLKRESLPATTEFAAKEVSDLWNDLVDDDAGKAFRSIRKLATAPQQVVSFLRDHVKPAVPVDPKKLDRLLSDLDSEDFEVRTNASAELEKLGELAVPALQKGQTGQITLETRRRIEHLLGRLIGGALTAEQVRLVRAVEVLERTGTPEARQLLEMLAKGAPGALATRQGQLVLDRIERSKGR